jgi:hypothetical protein
MALAVIVSAACLARLCYQIHLCPAPVVYFH